MRDTGDMAQRVEIILIDDLDGVSLAEETVRFALDGTAYEIDLSANHAAELRAHLNAYVGAARRSGGRRSSPADRRAQGSVLSVPGHRVTDTAVRQVDGEELRVEGLVYLDAAASTPMAPEAYEATVKALRRTGNPGAGHVAGVEAARVVDRARANVAELLRVGPASVVLTASATEANNLALRGTLPVGARRGIVTTTAEHPSVLSTVEDLEGLGQPARRIDVLVSGEVDLDALASVVTDETLLISIHAANNETGAIQPIEEVVALAHARGALVHADASQLMAWGEAPLLDECDLVTVSSHKMHGPQGAAALIVKASARGRLRPQVTGGGQERGLRSGTVNVAAVAGFGAAARLALATGATAATDVQALRKEFYRGLTTGISDIREHGATATRRLPGILNVAIGASRADSVESEALLARLPGLVASTGSACHSGAPGPSPVLLAMGVSEWEAARSIRLSLSRYTTAAEVSRAIAILSDGYADLMRLLGADDSEVRYI